MPWNTIRNIEKTVYRIKIYKCQKPKIKISTKNHSESEDRKLFADKIAQIGEKVKYKKIQKKAIIRASNDVICIH